MDKIIDYIIIHALTENNLTILIKQYIKKGWQPQGGMTVSTYVIETFYQAMVMYEPNLTD